MAKKKWVIGTEEAALLAGRQGVTVEVGDEAELELSYHEEKALVAAGWVEEPKTTKKKEG